MKINDFVTRQVGDDTIVVLSEQCGDVDRILKLNSTAAEILNMVSSGMSEDETASAIAKKYTIQREKALSDVQAVLTKLADQGLVEL